MDRTRAIREAEAKKYRLQVRLGLIVTKTKGDGANALLARAKRLRDQVDAVVCKEDEVQTRAAQTALAVLETDVLTLQAQAGVEEYGLPLMPKWMKFSLWTAPVVLGLGTLAFVLERRRRKSAIDADTLAALDAASEDP